MRAGRKQLIKSSVFTVNGTLLRQHRTQIQINSFLFNGSVTSRVYGTLERTYKYIFESGDNESDYWP